MGLFTRLFGGQVRKQNERFNQIVGMAVAHYLLRKYKRASQYDDDTALAVTAAVSNELFGMPPGNEKGRAFLATNKTLVDIELREIKNEPKICRIVSVANHLRANFAGNTSSITPEILMSLNKLHNFGILLPIENCSMPSSFEQIGTTSKRI
jgi:hypothetical protein